MSASRKGRLVMHRGRWSQTNGWALMAPEFIALPHRAIESVWTVFHHFHSLWCSAGRALHGWVTGALLH